MDEETKEKKKKIKNPRDNGVHFASDNEQQKKATAGKQSQKSKVARSATLAIQRSPAIATGGTNKITRRITPEVQEFIRKELTDPTAKGSTYIEQFISSFLKQAKADPSSRAGMLLASAMFSEDLLKHLDEEANKAMSKDIKFAQYNIRQTLYPKQQEVYDDDYDKTIVCICSRRVGKSELDARLLAKRCLRPDQHCVYINRSFDAAVRQIRKPLETALEAAGLTSYEGTIGGGLLSFPNGSQIMILGNNNAKDIDKMRGERIALIVFDECGHMRNMRQIVEEVVEPAMMDYADSQLILTGTPPRTKHNFIQELYDNPTIKKFHWTYLDNPFLPNRETVLEEVCKKHGVTPDDPFIRREYFGEMGATDEEAMVFHSYQKVDALPNKTWTHAYIAVDWGFEDKAAVTSIVADSMKKECFIVKTWSEAKKGIIEICEEVKRQYDELKTKYNISRNPVIVCDTNEKSASFELYNTYKLPNVMNAYKYEKNFAIEQLAEWLRTGVIKVVTKDNDAMLEDLNNTMWLRDEETDELKHEIDDDCWHPNAAMALLYASRMVSFDILGVVTSEAEGRARRLIENV